MMGAEKHLLLLAAFVALATCQPKVSLSPPLSQIFTGDFLYLSCDDVAGETKVKWYFNDKIQTETNKILKIAAASPSNTGNYKCEGSGQTSNVLHLEVEDFVPMASLTMETGQPVMQTGLSVILKIEHDDGLKGWNCSVYDGTQTKYIKLRLKDNPGSLLFRYKSLNAPETVFWCTDLTENYRSNQVVVRTSGKPLSLEMYPLPAVAGENLTLKCLVWGAEVIKSVIFYRGGAILQQSDRLTYEIPKVTKSAGEEYSCQAVYTYLQKSSGPPYDELSDTQDVPVQKRPKAAVLSEHMSCSCPECTESMSYRFYKKDGESWKALKHNEKTDGAGTYRCRMVLRNMRTLPSNARYHSGLSELLKVFLFIVVILIILAVVAGGIYYWRKRSNNRTDRIYEDVGMQARGDDKYEPLQGRGREGEYDALQKKGGEYEALKKEEMKEGVYHTVGPEGATGGATGGAGEGGYEALKKEGMKEGVYHTVGPEGATGGATGGGGEGGYEALKKEGMKDGVYHTLENEGATAGGRGGGEGGYEALKKEGMKDGVYHTLGAEAGQKAGGKKDNEKESEIVEL